ncbi:MAG: HAMP domain-containing protein, partial [Acidobacteriota bacterium]
MKLIPFYSFRTRIATILILTAVAATAVTYGFSRRAVRSIVEEVQRQREEFVLAINIAQQSLINDQNLQALWEKEKQQQLHNGNIKPAHATHVQRILVVNSAGAVKGSSVETDITKQFTELGYGAFDQETDSSKVSAKSSYELYKIPCLITNPNRPDTNSNGYIIIVYYDDLKEELRGLSLSRLFTTGVLLFICSVISLILILQFTRPVGLLITAAKRVAAGDFNISLPIKRRDELGNLM